MSSRAKYGLYDIVRGTLSPLFSGIWNWMAPKPKEIQSDDVVLIAGGAGAVGTSLSKEFAKIGCKLILLDKNEQELQELVSSIQRDYDVSVFWCALDITNYDKVREYLTDIMNNVKIIPTIFVFNAAITSLSLLHETTLEQFQQIMSVNLYSFLNIMRCIYPAMLERDRGHIVAMSSILGAVGSSLLGLYCVTKAGLARLMETLEEEADELGKKGLRFTTVFPSKISGKLFESVQYNDIPSYLSAEIPPSTVAERVVKAIRLQESSVYIPAYFGLLLNCLPKRVLSCVSRMMTFKVNFPDKKNKISAPSAGSERSSSKGQGDKLD